MKEYDVIVIGSGSGSIISNQALAHGFKVALVDKGPIGGTCLNVGCIPSKLLIFPADRVREIQEAERLGIRVDIKNIDFHAIMERMRGIIRENQNHVREGIHTIPDLDFYEDTGRFIDDYTLEVKGEKIKGQKIFIVSGARPLIPQINGIEDVGYLTNETLLKLEEKPESLIIVGGGYIAAEFAHFFSAMGTRVTVLQRAERLVKEEEPEISDLLKKKMEERMDVHTSTEVLEAGREGERARVVSKDRISGEKKEFVAEKILIAAGRKSNADLLEVGNSSIETDERNYIKVDDSFETSKENIWALGDAIGKAMFKHSANVEASLVWHNAVHGAKDKLDFSLVPHAVFTYPQIASVGLKEAEAKERHKILVGKAMYNEVAKGKAMKEDESFAKIIIEKESWKILGFHIIGPYAPILIQEVINAMAVGGTVMPLINGMHIHPALPEVVQTTLENLREPA